MSDEISAGVHFPADGEGVRSTTATTKGVLADAVRRVDPALADRIEGVRDWRKGYVDLVHDVTAASAASADAARRIADDGLASMRRRMVLVDVAGDEAPLDEATVTLPAGAAPFGSDSVRGTADPVAELRVPVGGRELAGDELRGQLAAWVDAGVVEPSFAAAVAEVIDHPEWLALPGRASLRDRSAARIRSSRRTRVGGSVGCGSVWSRDPPLDARVRPLPVHTRLL